MRPRLRRRGLHVASRRVGGSRPRRSGSIFGSSAHLSDVPDRRLFASVVRLGGKFPPAAMASARQANKAELAELATLNRSIRQTCRPARPGRARADRGSDQDGARRRRGGPAGQEGGCRPVTAAPETTGSIAASPPAAAEAKLPGKDPAGLDRAGCARRPCVGREQPWRRVHVAAGGILPVSAGSKPSSGRVASGSSSPPAGSLPNTTKLRDRASLFARPRESGDPEFCGTQEPVWIPACAGNPRNKVVRRLTPVQFVNFSSAQPERRRS